MEQVAILYPVNWYKGWGLLDIVSYNILCYNITCI